MSDPNDFSSHDGGPEEGPEEGDETMEGTENTAKAAGSGTGKDPARLFFGTPRQALSRYTHCVQCNGRLHFSHMTDFSRNLTEETVRCPECGTQDRKVLHRLQ